MSIVECGGACLPRSGGATQRPPSAHSKAALRAAVLLVFAVLACSPRPMTRGRWLEAAPAERLVYVKALLGAEAAKEAKGGNPRRFSKLPSAYVEAIDHAYANGDSRTADKIFESLADPPR